MPDTTRYPTWAEEREACWAAVRAIRYITHDDLPLAIEQAEAQLQADLAAAQEEIRQYGLATTKLKDELITAQEALRRYGRHRSMCSYRPAKTYDFGGEDMGRPELVPAVPCDCGLAAALRASAGDQ